MNVPNYDNLRTSIQGGSRGTATAPGFQAPRVDGPQEQMSADVIGKQGEALTKAAMGFAATIAEAEEKAQKEADEIRVLDAVNLAKEKQYDLTYANGTGYQSQAGLKALQRDGETDLANEYADAFKNHANDIASTLGNERQRQMFAKHADAMRLEIYGGAERHMAKEFTTYKNSVYNGIVSTGVRDISVNYTDTAMPTEDNPEGGKVYQSAKTIEGAVRASARLNGLSQLEADGAVLKATSSAHRVAVEAALSDGNVDHADKYLKSFGWQMSATDLLKAKSDVKKEMIVRDANLIGAGAIRAVAPNIFAGDTDRAWGVLKHQESGGNHWGKNGAPLTSPSGAIGLAQIMPDTGPEAAKMAGVKWKPELFNQKRTGDPVKDRAAEEYNETLGRAYFNAKLVKYDGDMRKAWAAYNAGDKWVDAAIAASEKDAKTGAYRTSQSPTDWFDKLNNDGRTAANRKQTREYVENNTAAYQKGEGQPAVPTLMDVYQRVDESLMARYGNNVDPSLRQHARDVAAREFKALNDAKKTHEEETVTAVQRELVANGGKYEDLAPGLRTKIPPGKVDDLKGFAKRISAPETDWSLFYKLSADPALLANVQLDTFKDKLADGEFKHLVTMQTNLKSKGPEAATNFRSAHQVFDQYVKSAGLTARPNDAAGQEKVGRLAVTFQERLTAAEQANGGKLTAIQVNEVAASVFKPTETSGKIWNSKTVAGLVGAEDRVQVPAAERAKIVAALTKQGAPINESVIEDLYRRANRIPQYQKKQ